MHKFGFELVIKEHLTNGDRCLFIKLRHAVTDSCLITFMNTVMNLWVAQNV